jgi:60 kDa SS-A/Ro ribonucleoprotein
MNQTLATYSRKQTPQSQPIPGSTQIANSAGGYSWSVDPWARLTRFLVLGSTGGSFYARERELTGENIDALRACLRADGARFVREVAALSQAGRAPKNDYALFALALAMAEGDPATRKAAGQALPGVARIGTHLLQFAAFADKQRGWGRGLRRAVAAWYEEQELERLAYQLVKYRNRHGFTHRDVLRLAHPSSGEEGGRAALYDWACGREVPLDALPRVIQGFERAQRAQTAHEAAQLVSEYGLTHEALKSEHLAEAAVWEALLAHMPLGAMVRNLARMTANGLLGPQSAAVKHVVAALEDAEAIKKARLHPLSVLSALKTYEQGRGERGRLEWTPVRQVVDALDGAFYRAFGAVEPTGKRLMLAIDISGSMEWDTIHGVPGLTPRVAAGALALVTANVESEYLVSVFSSSYGFYGRNRKSAEEGIELVDLSPRQRLDDALETIAAFPAGGTDCALPMLYAAKHELEVDCFVVFTDSESWAGPVHASQALEQYRRQSGIPARLVCCAMVANEYSVADPDDAGQLDVVGFDTATPQIVSDFARGLI